MEELQNLINYKFNNVNLLQLALTHKSFNTNHNERLEFLGDSILGLIIAKYLFNTFTDISEGKLTRIKSSLVRGETLSEIATEIKLGSFLKLGTGEKKSGGRNNKSTLENSLEALFGAIFLDSDFTTTEKVVLKLYNTRLTKIDLSISLKDNKSKLQEFLQKQGKNLPVYKLITTKGKDHNATFVVKASLLDDKISTTASAKSIKIAQQNCAKVLLERLIND
jgi:ribonuclease-3